jgi:hypothetical protein
MTPQPIYTRMCDVENVFSVTDDTVRKWAKSGAVRLFKVGGVSLVKTAEVVAHIEASAVQSGG